VAEIHTKRWDDPIEPADGTRILICRYRPRGLPKQAETWTEWQAHLAPSKSLHAGAYAKQGDKVHWDRYRVAYLREMRDQTAAIEALARRVISGETLTLLCSSACDRESRCHRSLLKTLIESHITRLLSEAGSSPA